MQTKPMLWLCLAALSACKGDGPGRPDPDDVDHGELLGIGVIPNDPAVAAGEIVQFRAQAFYEDTSYEDVTADVTWISSDERVATVDAAGNASALVAGQAEIIALNADGTSSKVLLTVKGADLALQSVTASPPSLQLYPGRSAQITAQAVWSDGSTGNVAGSCAWSSQDTGIATVDPTGKVTAVARGSATVQGDCSGNALSVAVDVVEDGVDLGAPDLRVSFLSAEVVDDIVRYTAIVENDGDGYASGFYLDAYLNLPGPPGYDEEWDGYAWVPGLAAGASVPVYVDVEDAPSGTFTSYVLADADGWVDESDENNNASPAAPVEIAAIFAGPNLVIYSFEALSDGEFTAYSVTVANTGDVASGPFWLDLFADPYSDPEVGDVGDDYVYVPSLLPDEGAVWEPVLDVGPYYYWTSAVLADSAGDVDERNEDDNVGWVGVSPD